MANNTIPPSLQLLRRRFRCAVAAASVGELSLSLGGRPVRKLFYKKIFRTFQKSKDYLYDKTTYRTRIQLMEEMEARKREKEATEAQRRAKMLLQKNK